MILQYPMRMSNLLQHLTWHLMSPYMSYHLYDPSWLNIGIVNGMDHRVGGEMFLCLE